MNKTVVSLIARQASLTRPVFPLYLRCLNSAPNIPTATFTTTGPLRSPHSMASNQDAEITLHWLDRSRSQRIVWLFEELDLKYNLTFYKRGPDQFAPPALKEVHPLGKSPVVTIKPADGDEPIILAESANIVEYIVDHFGERLVPGKWKVGREGKAAGETEEWLRYRFFMNYTEGSLMSLLFTGILKDGIKNAPVPFFIKPFTSVISGKIESGYLKSNYATHLPFLEAQLKNATEVVSTSKSPISDNGPFFCGPNLTAADIMMVFGVEVAQEVAGVTKETYPLLTEYLSRLQEREAYKRAVQRIIDETGSYQKGI